MKKLKKNDLSLDKEVITSLSSDNLDSLRGGIISGPFYSCEGDCPPIQSGNGCPPVELYTQRIDCPTYPGDPSNTGCSRGKCPPPATRNCPPPMYTKFCDIEGRPVTY